MPPKNAVIRHGPLTLLSTHGYHQGQNHAKNLAKKIACNILLKYSLLITVNITALLVTSSSVVKQAVVEALAERTKPGSSHSPQALIAEQSVAEAAGASLASITQGTPQSYLNGLTLADPAQGSQAPKKHFLALLSH